MIPMWMRTGDPENMVQNLNIKCGLPPYDPAVPKKLKAETQAGITQMYAKFHSSVIHYSKKVEATQMSI